MAPLNLFGKKLKGENKYFEQRRADVAKSQPKQPKKVQPPKKVALPEPQPEEKKYLVSNRKIDKDLLTELFKTMRNHDVHSSVVILANTLDTVSRRAGIMINKGYIPKRIVTDLQNIGLRHIEDALKLVKTRPLF